MQNYNVMPDTWVPGQQNEEAAIQALVEALRQPTGASLGAGAPQLASAASPQGLTFDSQTTNALGGGLNNVWTANKYGTNIGSQQTNMLAAQDAAFK